MNVKILVLGPNGRYRVATPNYEACTLITGPDKVKATNVHPFGLQKLIETEDNKGRPAEHEKKKKKAFERLIEEVVGYASKHGAPYAILEFTHHQHESHHEIHAQCQLMVPSKKKR